MQFIINAIKEIKARSLALRNGMLLESFQGGFLVKDIHSGEYLNDHDLNEVTIWEADDVIEFCGILSEGRMRGVCRN